MKFISFPHKSIILGFATSGILMVVLFFIVLNRMEMMHTSMNSIVHRNNVSTALATKMRDIIHKRQISIRNMFIYTDYFDRDEERLRFYSYAGSFINSRNGLRALLQDEKELRLYSEIEVLAKKAYPLQNELVELALTDISIEDVEQRLQETFILQSNVIELLTQLLKHQQHSAESSLTNAEKSYENARFVILILGSITAFIVLIIAGQVTHRTKSQTRRIQELSKMPIENPSPVIRVKNDGTILFVNEASYCLLDDWGCSLGEKMPHEWQQTLRSIDDHDGKLEMIIPCKDKIFSLTIVDFKQEGYVNFYGRDITDSERLKKKIEHQASHDSLTGLINRREFEKRVNETLQDNTQEGYEHALLYLDLDKFKIVNDTCGHAAGDKLLINISRLMSRQIRRSDTLARLGGDEFGVLLNSCSQTKANIIAENIRHAVNDFNFNWDNEIFKIGVSIGISNINDDSDNLSTVLSNADSACYTAKQSGRNKVCFFGDKRPSTKQKQGELEWIQHINSAIHDNEFVLHFQHIVPLQQQASDLVQGEVLLRMTGEHDKLIYPTAFIIPAERYNLMTNIDRWVVSSSLKTIGMQHVENIENRIACSINISGQSIDSEEFLNFLVDSIKSSQVIPHLITFEINESAVTANLDSAIIFIDTVKALGCRCALDNFGGDLSSFNNLRKLNVDYLKIDGIYLRNVSNDPVNLSIVKAINQVGHALNIETIAEIVDQDLAIETLKEIGVDYGQGYSFSKPIELSLAIQSLSRRKKAS